jgi:hypothetical protein
MLAEPDKYAYNRFGYKGKRVGQAVYDILSKPQADQTVGETLDAFGPDYAKFMEETIEENQAKFDSPFYIFVLTKKEFWANNILRNWFVARQTPPHAFDMMEQYSNYTKTLYLIDGNKGQIKCLWSLPSFDECLSIARCPENYDSELVKWVEECFTRKMDRDSYSFDWSIFQ